MLVLQSRMMGVQLPFPATLPGNDFFPAADWIARQRAGGAPVLFVTPVSFAVRIADCAAKRGLDISGTLFLSGAEPLTEAKRTAVQAAGAEVFSRYGISELGRIGCACRSMSKENCVHVMRDSIAVISHRRRPPLADADVDSLLFTTLLSCAAFVLINVEMDDCGTIEPAACGCPLAAMGFTQQIRNVFSFGKLTGQGVTLLAGDMLNLLERSLPRRFGGTPGDYQLVEREGSPAVVELRVSPRVGIQSEEEVRRHVLSRIRELWGGSLAYRQWSQTGGFRVVSAEPIISGGRKVNPLMLLSAGRKENE
jgi:phenylacetate-coenzyme A ligase PaaK-like adenylate-forming protein